LIPEKSITSIGDLIDREGLKDLLSPRILQGASFTYSDVFAQILAEVTSFVCRTAVFSKRSQNIVPEYFVRASRLKLPPFLLNSLFSNKISRRGLSASS
jgi:hypothetical protein